MEFARNVRLSHLFDVITLSFDRWPSKLSCKSVMMTAGIYWRRQTTQFDCRHKTSNMHVKPASLLNITHSQLQLLPASVCNFVVLFVRKFTWKWLHYSYVDETETWPAVAVAQGYIYAQDAHWLWYEFGRNPCHSANKCIGPNKNGPG